MKNFWNKTKSILAGVGVLLSAALSLAFFLNRAEVENTLNDDELLTDEGHSIDNKINGLESELDIPPDDLTDQQIEDYWN